MNENPKCMDSMLPPEVLHPRRIPYVLKVAYTLFVAVFIPCYWLQFGVQNFLWASDIALFATLVALWREDALLASTMAIVAAVPELAWNTDFFSRLVMGRDVFGFDATGYIFDPAIPRFLRALSLFHVFLPVLLLWLVWKLGYDRRGLAVASLLAWIVLPVCYLVTDPARNINWVFGIGNIPLAGLSGLQYLAAWMAAVPLLLYLPAHLVLQRLFGNQESRFRVLET